MRVRQSLSNVNMVFDITRDEYDLLYGLSSWVNTNFSTDPKVMVGAPMLKKEINSNTKNEIGSTYLIFNCGWKVNYWVYYLRFYR